ncbi:hypothetical protein NPIL_337961 [Nephila pilipes]|uniref:Uncharacterized protein n=1 Tax=Nephila pilipes TaxID=299642 RepID=A0A8X6UAQ9_NEPPI|nr:hypothetical protein NPIL_337961 [Nephila pilipes]
MCVCVKQFEVLSDLKSEKLLKVVIKIKVKKPLKEEGKPNWYLNHRVYECEVSRLLRSTGDAMSRLYQQNNGNRSTTQPNAQSNFSFSHFFYKTISDVSNGKAAKKTLVYEFVT